MEASTQPLRAPPPARMMRAVHAGPLIGLIAQVLLLATLAGTVGLSAGGWVVGLMSGLGVCAALAYGLVRSRCEGLRAADWVTLARASLAVGVAALVANSFAHGTAVTLLVSITGLALALDFVDGRVARRTGTTATLGARFDGEADAFLILILSVYVARSAGWWVLAIGAARYAFLIAGWPLPWMRASLPTRDWRKVVAATEGIVLAIAAAGVLPRSVIQPLLLGALVLLGESFGRDVAWLWRRHRVDRSLDRRIAAPTGRAGPGRAGVAATVTGVALLVVWAALVAPDEPQDLTLTAFLRVPLEGLVLVVLAVVLPATARRLVAALAGPALGLLVILRILDIGFFSAFARPFDPVGDIANLGIGVETLRAAIGDTQTNLLIVGVAAGVVGVIALTTFSLFWLMRVAAGHRRSSLRAVAALGAVWLVCAAAGAQVLSHTAVASTSAAGFILHEVGTVQADIRDSAVFAKQIRHDSFGNVPGSRLLTGLRGKDVLLVFVESYGQVSVQGSSFSPAIDALLREGTKQLGTAGFSARSAFVNAPGFGGISWLAHSTLQSGVWANSQRRYDQLVDTKRFNLTEAFDRAGWQTVNFAPADDRAWPEGSSFYHYDTLYDRREMGYHGPNYNYAPMPDQYMFAALQRLELSRTHRRPVFAEVDTVSSHMPWNRIPQMIPWSDVGDGAVFHRTPTFTEPDSFWWHPNQVKAAYARSLEYSLNTLISFVRRYGKKNLVLVVVGDEQPLPIVSGQGASHDVPISIIAHDPSVMKRINGWDWQAGLLAGPQAPVWRMSAFRDRFLNAYGPKQQRR